MFITPIMNVIYRSTPIPNEVGQAPLFVSSFCDQFGKGVFFTPHTKVIRIFTSKVKG